MGKRARTAPVGDRGCRSGAGTVCCAKLVGLESGGDERWWRYTMTNVAKGQAISGRNKGWRKAIRFALTVTHIADSVIKKRNSDFELTLFQK